jgi:hypothetical protein
MVSFEVRKHQGSTFLFKDEKPLPAILAWVGPEFYDGFKRAGIRIVTWGVPSGWIGKNKFDYTITDMIIEKYLDIDSDILFLPRVSFPGKFNDWWCKSHPRELVMLSNGEIGSGHSSASIIWRQEAAEALTRLIRHIENSSYADHIVGYHICDGHWGEWFAFDTANFVMDELHKDIRWVCRPGYDVQNCPTPFPDYSEPMTKAFREWLKKKYNNDVEALRKAWNDPNVDFSSVTIPNRLERVLAENILIRDPSKNMKTIDYDLCFQDAHSDTILELCKTAKDVLYNMNSKKIIGVFYGYLFAGFFRGFYMQHAGHLALSKILKSPFVDFIASPYDYENRTLGGVNFSQTLPSSIMLHGKLYFNEVDTMTFVTPPETPPYHLEDWRPRTLEDTVELLKRDYSYAHAMGFGMWWMDLMRQGWYYHEGIIDALRKMQEIEKRLLEYDRSSNREIAIILDEKSLIYERPCQNLMASLQYVTRQWELGYIGAPFDTYLQSDLLNPELKDYKLYLFFNNIHLTKAEKGAIAERLKRDGKFLFWVWAPGLILDEQLSLENIYDLTGINVNCEKIKGHIHIDIINYEHLITQNLWKGYSFGPEIGRYHNIRFKEAGFIEDDPTFSIGPIFYVDDNDATVLGWLPIINKPGFCIKSFGNWTSIYSAVPYVSKDILRNIAHLAGVHIYSDGGDLVYANKHFLSIHTRIGGPRTIKLPSKRDVIDLWSDKKVAEDTLQFNVEMKMHHTYMYLLE